MPTPHESQPALADHGTGVAIIRIVLPFHLRTLAKISGEESLSVPRPVTRSAVLDSLEAKYPMLQGTIRDHITGQRRAFLRFFACEEDLSNEPADAPLPASVIDGVEPYLIIGALAGG